jgi:hypothetical protein
MKRIGVAIILFSILSVTVKAQKKSDAQVPQLPVDSITNLITYEGVVTVAGVKADVLYKRALSWFHEFYKNPTEVIRENDSLKFKIVGKPRFKISNPADKSGLKTDGGLVQYTITVGARDGRFKFELTEFNWKQQSYYPSERWMDMKAQSYNSVYADYLKQLDQYSNDLIINLKNALMNEKAVKDKDKW